jgi:Ser/Thr protein kinase RdoA (MazF antagonist)
MIAARARLERRADSGRLAEHLATTYGVEVGALTSLDLGVFRVERLGAGAWVARLHPAVRSRQAAAGDAEVLAFLARHDFPSERVAAPDPVSVLDGEAVVVTEFVEGVPPAERRQTIRASGGLRRLGELLGRLHTMPGGAAVAGGRSGGGWHHLVDGTPADEVAATAGLLSDARGLVPDGERAAFDSLRRLVDDLEGGAGLPVALTHPDFVLANVVASASDGMVLVDWSGAGQGPRLCSLAFLLYAEGARGLPRIDRIIDGYRSHVALEDEEVERLPAALWSRPVVLNAWSFALGRAPLAQMVRASEDAVAVSGPIAERAGQLLRAGTWTPAGCSAELGQRGGDGVIQEVGQPRPPPLGGR